MDSVSNTLSTSPNLINRPLDDHQIAASWLAQISDASLQTVLIGLLLGLIPIEREAWATVGLVPSCSSM